MLKRFAISVFLATLLLGIIAIPAAADIEIAPLKACAGAGEIQNDGFTGSFTIHAIVMPPDKDSTVPIAPRAIGNLSVSRYQGTNIAPEYDLSIWAIENLFDSSPKFLAQDEIGTGYTITIYPATIRVERAGLIDDLAITKGQIQLIYR